jgi:hypothetical protein
MGYCTLCAIQLRLKINELAGLLGGKTGRNSLILKKLLGGIFREARGSGFQVAEIKNHSPEKPALKVAWSAQLWRMVTGMPGRLTQR